MLSKIQELGQRIDDAFDLRDIGKLEKCLSDANDIELLVQSMPDELMVLYYFKGNLWAYINSLRNHKKESSWYYNQEELVNAIMYYRKAVLVKNVSRDTFNNIGIQAYTNLGNEFSYAGRTIFAIECWTRALAIFPLFGMANVNLAKGLIYYAKMMYDKTHASLMLRFSYKKLKAYADSPNVYLNVRSEIYREIKDIESVFPPEFLSAEDQFADYSLGRSKGERKYREWVLKNSLFLNPLNEVFHETAVAHDVLFLPDMSIKKYEAPVFHGFYNQIKQEFITARYLYFQYLHELPEYKRHHSDNERNLVNVFDYTQYSFRHEILKNSFRMLYSIFDKVAYFINEYLDLGVDKNKVSFRTIWFKNGVINPKIERLNNLPLRGLFFLSKEFFSKNSEYTACTNPDARDISDIRNNLEHKYFKIHWWHIPKKDDALSFDPLAYSVMEEDFCEKVFRLLHSAREALIYLSLLVHAEEQKHFLDGIALPLSLSNYD